MAAPQQLQYVMLQQADGHPTVALRAQPGEKHSNMLPNGTIAGLVQREGAYLRIITREGHQGYVKARNARLVMPKKSTTEAPAAPAPAPAAPQQTTTFPSAAPKKAAPAVSVCSFTVNGTPYTIDLKKANIDAEMSVHDWIALNVPNSAARRSCGVGRCGSCVAMLSHKQNGKPVHRSFNTCLRPILACNGMAITTGAGIGSTQKPHPVQQQLAQDSGTQCGFCSVGMVMNLYSRLAQHGTGPIPVQELDSMVDSNYCRCTGYRPILKTYKSFAKGGVQAPAPAVPTAAGALVGTDDADTPWVEVTDESELEGTLLNMQTRGVQDYFLVGGYTSKGLWPERSPKAMISIGGVQSLNLLRQGAQGVTIGAGATISDALEFLEQVIASQPAAKTQALVGMLKHGKLSPGGNIRNTGTIGGNVMIAYRQKSLAPFPTEWPMLLSAAGATVTFRKDGKSTVVSIDDLWSQDLSYAYLQAFTVPFSSEGDVYRTYRTAQRHIYSEAFAAAAFSANVQNGVIKSARVVYNNIEVVPARLKAIEAQMVGMSVGDEAKFQSLATQLQNSLQPKGKHGSAEFRKSLCVAYFYKFFLAMQPSLPDNLKSGALSWLEKEVTKGVQKFPEDSSVAPLNEPLPKIDGLKQTTGEAEYVQNIPLAANALHAAPLLATKIGSFTLDDSAVAVKVPGYRGMVLAKDVPNNSSKLLADGSSAYIGHPLAMVLATTPGGAVKASRLINVTYSGVKTNVIRTIDDARAAGSFYPDQEGFTMRVGDVEKGFSNSQYVVSDKWGIGAQYHFHMETQSAYAVPSNDGPMVVHSATQMPTFTAQTVRAALGNLPESKVAVVNRRCGGGFGGKLTNAMPPAALAAVCANARRVPVSLVYEQNTNMLSLGLRPEWQCETKVGFDATGKINALQMRPFVASGAAASAGGTIGTFIGACDNCYNIAAWDIQGKSCKTDLPANTSMRAPGWMPGIYFMERTITTVAMHLGVEPHVVRQANFYKRNEVTPYGLRLKSWDIDTLWAEVKASSAFEKREAEVRDYNTKNRWTKKGLTLVASKFTVGYGGSVKENATLMDVYLKVNKDGTVNVMSGGTEIGQGLTTKVAQTVSYHLGVPMSDISFLDQDTRVVGVTGAQDVTGGSVGSELTCRAAKNTCDKVNAALATIRKSMPSASWKEIVARAYELGISLSFLEMTEGTPGPEDPSGHVYCTYGVVALEVTLDVLTGQVDMSRADILYDLGRSVNQIVDIGQIEGAFVMGSGLALTESVQYDADGAMNWADYVIPTPWEIPTEFNVSLEKQIVNPATVGGGRAIGEPPMTMTYATVEAVELALRAAARDSGASQFRSKAAPVTIDARNSLCNLSVSQMKLR